MWGQADVGSQNTRPRLGHHVDDGHSIANRVENIICVHMGLHNDRTPVYALDPSNAEGAESSLPLFTDDDLMDPVKQCKYVPRPLHINMNIAST